MTGNPQPVANGLRTDHPVPNLPFVDDRVLTLDDPAGIEAIGRNVGEGMWGRYDDDPETGRWHAFTTDPHRHDLAWVVRHHPAYGTSVMLYRDDDAASAQHEWWETRAFLERSGGYWWDGETWYRPAQVWDGPSEKYEQRPVRSAVTVTAADVLDDSADPGHGSLLKVEGFDPEQPYQGSWLEDLALWAAHRTKRKAPRLPTACVIRLSAPELAADQLIGITELAEAGGIAASTLRAYITRGQGEIPVPQAVVGGRPMWSRPVARDWADARHRSPDAIAASLASATTSLTVGQAEIQQRHAHIFRTHLWENPDRRKRWALRHRTEAAVTQTAEELAFHTATDLKRVIPPDALASTIRHALLDELADRKNSRAKITEHTKSLSQVDEALYYGIGSPVARMLGWLVRHFPNHAAGAINETIHEAEHRHQIPRKATEKSLRDALRMEGKLTPEALDDFLSRVLPEQQRTR